MDTRDLQLFLHLSDSLHFGRTSQAMHISASALTRTIQNLEESLDTRLFERDNRSVALTRSGQLLQDYAREAIQKWQQFQYSLMEETQELQGNISIYCSVTASYSFLYNILTQFRQAHPKIGIRLHTGSAEYSIDRVQEGLEDLAIATHPGKLTKPLDFKPIATSPIVTIASREMAVVDCWDTVPFILSEKGVVRKRLNSWFQQQGIKPNIYAQVDGNEAIVSMVSLGYGLGVIPKIVLENSPLATEVVILQLGPKLGKIEVGLCALKKKLQNPLTKALWDSIKTT